MTIVVAGGTGLAGSAIVRAYQAAGHEVVPVSRKVVDLLDRDATFRFIKDVKPTLIVDAAAKVGGIGANNSFPVEFLSDNVRIQSNLMEAAHAADVEKFIFLGSSCIYPRDCAQPIKEEYLLTGPLEETNSAYAVAKIAGIELIKSFRKEYGRKWISLMPLQKLVASVQITHFLSSSWQITCASRAISWRQPMLQMLRSSSS